MKCVEAAINYDIWTLVDDQIKKDFTLELETHVDEFLYDFSKPPMDIIKQQLDNPI